MYDAIVVGAGCAGTATAMLLTRHGRRVLLVDRSGCDGEPGPIEDLGPEGRAMLHRWGLLGRVAASTTWSTAGMRTVTIGKAVSQLKYHPFLGSQAGLAVARPAFRRLLADAAAAEGVTVRWGFTVTDVVWREGRVVGVVGRDEDGRARFERSRMVIGADGRHSLVAAACRAAPADERPAQVCGYTACWTRLDGQVPEIFFLDGLVVSMVPAGEVATVTVWLPVGRWAGFKRRPEETYREQIDRLPSLSERMAGARRHSRFWGTADLTTGFRVPFGPGWALVGDAGHRADPVAGYGTGESLVDAELLAGAVDAGLSAGPPMAVALDRYARIRDERSRLVHTLACQIGGYEWSLADVRGRLEALADVRAERIVGLAA